MSLNPRQQRFVEEYLIDLNATGAADRVGYKHPHVQGPRLLGNVRVAAAIAQAQAKRSERTEITQDQVLRELARIGFADIRKLMSWSDEQVTFVPSDELTEEQAAVISEVGSKTRVFTDEDGNVERTIELKLKTYDKVAALVKMGQHLGMFVERHEHSGPNGGPIEVAAQLAAVPDKELFSGRDAVARKTLGAG